MSTTLLYSDETATETVFRTECRRSFQPVSVNALRNQVVAHRYAASCSRNATMVCVGIWRLASDFQINTRKLLQSIKNTVQDKTRLIF